jgi:hypothetical protein
MGSLYRPFQRQQMPTGTGQLFLYQGIIFFKASTVRFGIRVASIFTSDIKATPKSKLRTINPRVKIHIFLWLLIRK